MSEIRSQATPAYKAVANRRAATHALHHDLIDGGPKIDAKFSDIHHMAANAIKAGWSKPLTVNDVDQLEALPAGTVLRNNKSGRVFEKARDKGAGKSKWMRMQDRWVYETYEILNESTWTVLFTPGGE